jgi:hypothetical protein
MSINLKCKKEKRLAKFLKIKNIKNIYIIKKTKLMSLWIFKINFNEIIILDFCWNQNININTINFTFWNF